MLEAMVPWLEKRIAEERSLLVGSCLLLLSHFYASLSQYANLDLHGVYFLSSAGA